MPSQYFIAFWNLENLFDIEASPRRSDKIQRALGASIKDWTQDKLNRKVQQLASIIRQMNGGRGPDLLGVGEVENEYVMTLLVEALASLGRTYAIVHHDTDDQRGIDVGIVYDATLFTVEAQFNHFVMRRTATRDILQVNFFTPQGRRFVVVVNHWPSRLGDETNSQVYRAIAGETLAYFHERIWEVVGSSTPVLAMGDFNDEPFDRSLEDYALSTRSRTKVTRARNALFLNLMWPLMGQGLASFYYDNVPCLLDQFLADKNLLNQNAPIRVLQDTAAILRFPEMVGAGIYSTPIRFGGMGEPVNRNGFSDHFPVAVIVQEKS